MLTPRPLPTQVTISLCQALYPHRTVVAPVDWHESGQCEPGSIAMFNLARQVEFWRELTGSCTYKTLITEEQRHNQELPPRGKVWR